MTIMKKLKNKICAKVLALLGAVVMIASCEDPYEDSTYINEDNLPPLALTMSADSAATEWVKVLKYAGMYDALNYALDPFTVLLPSNEALDSFYAAKGVSAIDELGVEFAKDLVLTHTIGDSLKVDDFVKYISVSGGAELKNLAEEKLSVFIDTTEAGSFYLINEAQTSVSHVLEAEIPAYNGYIYRMDAVINPLNQSVYDLVLAGGNTGDANRFGIMKQALELTGWADSLSIIQDTLWYASGNFTVKPRYYTLLAVADEIFQKDGIGSLEALVSKLGAGADYASKENELNKYVAYHILNATSSIFDILNPLNLLEEDAETGELVPLSADSVKLIDTSAENLILQLTRRGCYPEPFSFVFNDQAESANFNTINTNVLAKNGYLHELDAYLPVWEPEQALVVWDLADYVSVKTMVESMGETYKPVVPVSSECKVPLSSLTDVYTYEVGGDGVGGNTYYNITYVNCKKNLEDANNCDRVVFNLGYMGWAQMKTPTLVHGKYRVELDFVYTFDHSFMRSMSDGSNGGLMKMTFDGGNEIMTAPYAGVSKNSVGVYTTVLYDEIEFETTSSHLMKFIVMDASASNNSKFSLQFDCIRFIPITE